MFTYLWKLGNWNCTYGEFASLHWDPSLYQKMFEWCESFREFNAEGESEEKCIRLLQ